MTVIKKSGRYHLGRSLNSLVVSLDDFKQSCFVFNIPYIIRVVEKQGGRQATIKNGINKHHVKDRQFEIEYGLVKFGYPKVLTGILLLL